MTFLDFVNKIVVDLFGMRGVLYRFERETISRVADLLSEKASKKLRFQLTQLNHFQRDTFGKKVYLRCIGWFCSNATFLESSLFDKNRPPFRLASVIVKARSSGKKFEAELWIVGGHLFELSYSKSPFVIFGQKNLNEVDYEIVDAALIADPSVNPFATAKKQTIGGSCGEDIAMLTGLNNYSELSAPYAQQFIVQVAADYSDFLPIAYIELLSHTDGCRFGDLKIYGLAEINSVVLKDTAVIAFAEIEGKGVFAVEERNLSKVIFFIDYIDDTRVKLGVDLPTAFRTILAI